MHKEVKQNQKCKARPWKNNPSATRITTSYCTRAQYNIHLRSNSQWEKVPDPFHRLSTPFWISYPKPDPSVYPPALFSIPTKIHQSHKQRILIFHNLIYKAEIQDWSSLSSHYQSDSSKSKPPMGIIIRDDLNKRGQWAHHFPVPWPFPGSPRSRRRNRGGRLGNITGNPEDFRSSRTTRLGRKGKPSETE